MRALCLEIILPIGWIGASSRNVVVIWNRVRWQQCFMVGGCLLCGLVAFDSGLSDLKNGISILLYCTMGFAIYQTLQTTLRLIKSLIWLCAGSFNFWYVLCQFDLFAANHVVMCVLMLLMLLRYMSYQSVSILVLVTYVLIYTTHYLLMIWFWLIIWTSINVILGDAMCEQSRIRVVCTLSFF